MSRSATMPPLRLQPSTANFHRDLKDSVLTESANATKNMVLLDSIEEEVGLACPPLDEEDCMLASGGFFDLSDKNFFNGIDDDDKSSENAHESSQTPNPFKQTMCPPRKGKELKILESVYKPNNKDQTENVITSKSLLLDEVSYEKKLESTKRKLHENYEQFSKEKRRRKIQFTDYVPQGAKPKVRHEKHFRPSVFCK